MEDYIRQIVENQLTENIFSSAVKKDQGRGVEKATGHAIELDMSKPNTNAKVKMAQDSKVVKGLITKGFTHAESSEGGNKVKLYFAGPRQRNTWLKKWRSLDIPKKTNEDYLSEKIRDDIPANVQKIAKELGKAVALHSSQAKRLRDAGIPDDEKLPAKVRKIPDELDKAVAAHKSQAGRLRKADISETKNYDAKQPKPIRIRGLTGQRITQVMKNMTPAQKSRLLKKLGPKVRKLTKGGAFVADRIMQQNESYKRGGHMSQIRKNELRDKVRKKITAKKIEGQKRRLKNQTQSQRER